MWVYVYSKTPVISCVKVFERSLKNNQENRLVN